MKHALILLTLSLLVACGSNADTASEATTDSTATAMAEAPATTATTEASEDATARKTYEVKSGIVEMKNSMMEGMKQTMYFDDYGARQATYSSMELMGTKTENVQLLADGWNITYDLNTKKGTRMKIPAGAFGNGSLVPSPTEMTDELKQKYNYKDLGTREVLGKETKGFSMQAMGLNVTAWTWNNVPLHLEMDMGKGKSIVMEATDIQTDVDIPADKFAVPADVKLEDVSTSAPIPAPGQ